MPILKKPPANPAEIVETAGAVQPQQSVQAPEKAPAPSRKLPKAPTYNRGLILLTLLCSLLGVGLGGASLWLTLQPEPEPEPEPEVIVEVEPEEVEGVDFFYFNGFHVPILEEMDKNEYVQEAFYQLESEVGKIFYEDARLGIDVSQFQGEIDWELVAADGVSFAFLRVGYRGYGEEGNIRLDETFHQNMEGAQAAGIDVGVYFFSQATSVWEVKEEVYFLLDELEGYELQLPVVFDWEFIDYNSGARTANVKGTSITLFNQVFCEMMENAGYTPMVYLNQSLAYLYVDLLELNLDEYPLWLASYRSTPNFLYHFDLWQYTDSGQIDGIEGNVDLNLMLNPDKFT